MIPISCTAIKEDSDRVIITCVDNTVDKIVYGWIINM